MMLVPMDTPGVNIVRAADRVRLRRPPEGTARYLDDVRVPRRHLLGDVGGGFAMAQARLGPGRIHHCMRSIGAAERALELMCARAQDAVAFGSPLASRACIQESSPTPGRDRPGPAADPARRLADGHGGQQGGRGARSRSIKVAVPQMAPRVIDRAIQVYGGAGSRRTSRSPRRTRARYLRLADGPDEVHRTVVAKLELRKYATR